MILVLAFVVAATVAFAGAAAALPALRRALMREVDHRSDHRVPTPQGGGLFVLLGAGVGLAATAALLATVGGVAVGAAEIAVAAAVTGAGALGHADDRRGLSARFRLAVQIGLAALAVGVLVAGGLAVPPFPTAVLVALAVVGVAWTMNAVNFVDGSDWITAAHALPALVGLGAVLAADGEPALALGAVALAGGVAGFAVLNRPPARLFLGDSGSLALGAGLALLALVVAGRHGVVAAALFLAYPIADATTTLAWRASRGARLAEAHRDHAYQAARDAGWSAARVAAVVLAAQVFAVGAGVFLCYTVTNADDPGLEAIVAGVVSAVVVAVLVRFRTLG